MEKELTTEQVISQMSEAQIAVVYDYSLVIKTLLKDKSLYPLKPGGLTLYQNLMKVRLSLKYSLEFQPNFLLQKLFFLLNLISPFSQEADKLQQAYSWLYKIASLLELENITEAQAKLQLVTFLNSLDDSDDPLLSSSIAKFKKVTFAWIDGLFRYLSEPKLPRTNNNLENFNGLVKKAHRHITGRKNTQSYISRIGSDVSFLLALPEDIDLLVKFSLVDYSDFRQAKDLLSRSPIRSKIYAIHRSLDDFLFELEIQWSSNSMQNQTSQSNFACCDNYLANAS